MESRDGNAWNRTGAEDEYVVFVSCAVMALHCTA